MPQIINTNIASLTAQRNLNSSQSANRTSLERLSSGLRINSAKDDAAGLAISTRFSSQIRGLSVAIRNAGDGISLAQTAEGALGSITDSLQRIRELALQSSNATNSDVDREALNAEASQLISEITRTGDQTDFNGTKLLDGNFDASFQVGANSGETVSFGIAELSSSKLGGGRTAGVSAIGSSNSLGNGDLVLNGAVVGPSVASDDTASFANSPSSAISKVSAINRATAQSGVVAEVITNVAAGSLQQEATGGTNGTSGKVNINGVAIDIATGDVDEAADRQGIVSAINSRSSETGVTAVDTGTRFGGVNLEAADGRNITVTFGPGNLTSASTGLTSQETTSGGYTLRAETSGSAIVISESTGDIGNSGLAAGTYSANTAAVSSTTRTSEDGAPTSSFDTAAVAATVSSSNNATQQAAQVAALGDFTNGSALEFDIQISSATTTSQNATFTVSVNSDLSGGTISDLANAINASITSATSPIAARASVGTDGNLTFSRTTSEAGDLEVRNFQTNGTTSAVDVATVLGVAQNTQGSGADVISADTVVGAQAATVTAAGAADTSQLPTTLSVTDSISFDISISGSSQQAAQTVVVTLDDNSLVNGTTSVSDLANVINAEILTQSTTIGVTASADANGNLVFTSNNAGAATLEVGNVNGNASISNAQAASVLGLALDDSNGNGVIGTGANGTTVGAVNAAANYFSAGNNFTAGAVSSTAVTFETGNAESAVLSFGDSGTGPTSTGIDLLAAGAINFDISLNNGQSTNIQTAAVAGASDATQAQVLSALNTALDSAFSTGAVIASFSNNQLELKTGVGGSQKSLEVTNVVGSPAADTLKFAGQLNQKASGLGGDETAKVTVSKGSAPNFSFDYDGVAAGSLGGTDVNVSTTDQLTFDVSYDNGTAVSTNSINLSMDSGAAGAKAVYNLAGTAYTANAADNGPSAQSGVNFGGSGAYGFKLALDGYQAVDIGSSATVQTAGVDLNIADFVSTDATSVIGANDFDFTLAGAAVTTSAADTIVIAVQEATGSLQTVTLDDTNTITTTSTEAEILSAINGQLTGIAASFTTSATGRKLTFATTGASSNVVTVSGVTGNNAFSAANAATTFGYVQPANTVGGVDSAFSFDVTAGGVGPQTVTFDGSTANTTISSSTTEAEFLSKVNLQLTNATATVEQGRLTFTSATGGSAAITVTNGTGTAASGNAGVLALGFATSTRVAGSNAGATATTNTAGTDLDIANFVNTAGASVKADVGPFDFSNLSTGTSPTDGTDYLQFEITVGVATNLILLDNGLNSLDPDATNLARIQAKLDLAGVDVTASLTDDVNDSRLTFTANTAGTGAISIGNVAGIGTFSGGTEAQDILGFTEGVGPAIGGTDSAYTFNVTVAGNGAETVTFGATVDNTVTAATTESEFLGIINDQLSNATASVVSNRLVFTSNQGGALAVTVDTPTESNAASGNQADLLNIGFVGGGTTALGTDTGVTGMPTDATIEETVAILQQDVDAALTAAFNTTTGTQSRNFDYTAGDVKVSIAANGTGTDQLILETKGSLVNNSIQLTQSLTGAALGISSGTSSVGIGSAFAVRGDSTNAAQAQVSTGGNALFDANHDFSVAGEQVSFDIKYTNASGTETVENILVDGAAAGGLPQLLVSLQSKVDAAFGNNVVDVEASQDINDGLQFRSTGTGDGVKIEVINIQEGTGNAAAQLGFATTADLSSTSTGAGNVAANTDDAGARLVSNINTQITASGFSTSTDFQASLDKDNNLVFETIGAGKDVELTVANYVGSTAALDALNVAGTARETGVVLTTALSTSLSSTAGDSGGAGKTGIDLSTTGATAAGDVFDFSLSYNGGPAVQIESAAVATGITSRTDATAEELVTALQAAVDTAFAGAASTTLGSPNSATGPAYDAGDIQVSIDSSDNIVFTTKETHGETTLQVTNGNNDSSAALTFTTTGVTGTDSLGSASAAQVTLKDLAGTDPVTGVVNGTGYDFSAANQAVTFSISYDDGSGANAISGTATFSQDLLGAENTRDNLVQGLQNAIDNVTGMTAGDVVASLDSDGFLKLTTDAARGASTSITINTFADEAGGAGLAALGFGTGTPTAYVDLSFADTGANSAIATNASGSRFNDEGKDQSAQNNTLTVTGLEAGDETITLSGSYTSQADVVSELNSKLTNATASLSDTGVITITDNDITQASADNTVGVSGNGAVSLGFDGSGNATAGIQNTGVGGAGNANQSVRQLLDGDLRISGVSISGSRSSDDTASNELANTSSKSASGISIAAAINRETGTTGVTAQVNATVVSGGTSNTDRINSGDQGELHINGISTGVLSLGTDKETNRANAIGAINQISGQTGVSAVDNGGGITLTAEDGRNISVAIDTLGTDFSGSNIGLDASRKGIAEASFATQGTNYAAVAATTSSTIRLESSKEFTVAAGTNGAEGSDGFGGLTGLGLQAGTYGGADSGQFLTEVDISTVEGALEALDAIDNALASVSSERANLGAIQNRLQSTIDNLSISVENLQAANSRILDADFAAETAELSRTQVLQQAGISILAQANAAPQQVLALLQ